MNVPSIKGSIFEGLLQDVRQAVAEGRADLDELRECLDDKDRALVDGQVATIQWVPMRVYTQILDYLTRVEGGADPIAYLQGRGAKACERPRSPDRERVERRASERRSPTADSLAASVRNSAPRHHAAGARK